MKKEKRKSLSLEDRQQIYVMRSKGLSVREIARKIRREASIISRELRRNLAPNYVDCNMSALERAKYGHDKSKQRQKEKKRGKRKAKPLFKVLEYISNKLQEGWSPECISARIGETFEGLKLSTSTIYRMIKKERRELIKYLPEKGKQRRQRVMERRGQFQQGAPEKRHISKRSKEANERTEPGHLEGDMVLSKKGSKSAILSICDRFLRTYWYIPVTDLQSDTVCLELVRFLHTLPAEQRKTLTFDRGSEFAQWDMLEKIFTGLLVYFCTAYSPHEKGSVERSNKELRRYFPKGTDFSNVSKNELTEVQNKINGKPMKCLNWKTPLEFREQINLKLAA